MKIPHSRREFRLHGAERISVYAIGSIRRFALSAAKLVRYLWRRIVLTHAGDETIFFPNLNFCVLRKKACVVQSVENVIELSLAYATGIEKDK